MFRLAVLALLLAGNVHAQPFPTKSMRIVVPWPPGGVTDVLTRVVAAQMSETLGQQVVVENRPGAGGTIGVGALAKAPADGYTLVMTDVPSHAISATLYPKLAYDVLREVPPVGAEVPGFDMGFYTALFAPARTPREVIERLHAETVKALEHPKTREVFAASAAEPGRMRPEELQAYVAKEVKDWGEVVRALDLRVD